jgi:glycosyltransferase involved in cell wall biosynthesis
MESSNSRLFLNPYDFNFELFYKDYPGSITSDKKKIILYYSKNITKFKNIYSEKIFYHIYPLFVLEEFKIFNKELILNFNGIIYEILNFYHNYPNKHELIISVQDFYSKYLDFNINIYKSFINNINLNSEKELILNFINNPKENIIYSNKTFYDKYQDFNLEFYKLFSGTLDKVDKEEQLLIHFLNSDKKIYNIRVFLETYPNFSINIYKQLNKDLENISDNELIIHWYKKGIHQNRIYSIESFYNIYPELKSMYDNELNINEQENNIITWMNKDIYKYIENKFETQKMIGRNIVNNIYEVLIDLKQEKIVLEPGLSLIIRAKNEELNIEQCIESVIDLVDEIIFVDNGSTDNTYQLVKDYTSIYSKIKLYSYNIAVSKVGVEHKAALESENKNTLGTFYNWCLSKATFNNVFKWDADFICIRNNFQNMIDLYNLRLRTDKFALWCTGKTLFENNGLYYYNHSSFYNEFRVFSYKNNFKWYDGEVCEYTEPYLMQLHMQKYHYNYPVFYEIKRTSLDEFANRSSMIDSRDINDLNIINSLKNSKTADQLVVEVTKDWMILAKLISLDNKFIEYNIYNISQKINILLFTPSLSLGGGNQFIINIYMIYKTFGFNVKIIPIYGYENKLNLGDEKYKQILDSDIINFKICNIEYIEKFNPTYIFFNSDIPYYQSNLESLFQLNYKIFFVTHSDVAYANFFISKYNKYFYKIITVNNYTITKLTKLLGIDSQKFYKLINYVNVNPQTNLGKRKRKIFGVITRFSEDKNIPMFLNALIKVFQLYPDYKCYLVGTHNEKYDEYLKSLVNTYFKINKFVYFEGYQDNTKKYYELFDFIVLPSVSEGCSYNIIEAMNYGVPVIASNVGGNHEILKNGLLYEYDGIRELEQKLIYIENYHQHLEYIGYVKNEQFSNKIFDGIELLIPHLLPNPNDSKIKIWNKNMNQISDSIIKLINMELSSHDMINKNLEFITQNFNQTIYINQLLELIS